MRDGFVKKMSTAGDGRAASPISHPVSVPSAAMKQAEFESLMFIDVEERAAAEPAPEVGKPKYHGRPWTRLRDEMLASGSPTVADLPAKQIALFYRATKSTEGSVMSAFRGLFNGG